MLRWLRQCVFIFGFILFLSDFGYARAPQITEEFVKISNQIMAGIYADILDQKDKYKELSDFNETALYENQHGIITIIYRSGLEPKDKNLIPYEFAVTIDHEKDDSFPHQPGKFNYEFPYFDIKISGYQRGRYSRKQFDAGVSINKFGLILSEYQQQFLPLRLFVLPVQNEYFTKENIEFQVVLKNVSKSHMYVKSLGPETLYFLINDQSWGTSPDSASKGGKRVILKAGQSLKMKFMGASFIRPQEIEVVGIYRMEIKGVHPFGSLRINLQKKEPNQAKAK